MEIDEPGLDKVQEYEAIVDQATKSNQPLSRESVAKIEQLIQDINTSEDPVYQVCCLQLIADLAASKQALAILDQKRVPEKLMDMLDQSDPLIIPHALKFFYRVSLTDLKLKYSRVLDKICDYCQSENNQLLDYAIDLVAAIARNGYPGRKLLDEIDGFREKCLKQLGSTLVCSDSLLKTRAIRCIMDLLEYYEQDPKEESQQLSNSFYHNIIEGENKMTNQLFNLCRVPFPEIRISAMALVASIVDQEWAQEEFAKDTSSLKWILDKFKEAHREGRETKLDVIRTLVKKYGVASEETATESHE